MTQLLAQTLAQNVLCAEVFCCIIIETVRRIYIARCFVYIWMVFVYMFGSFYRGSINGLFVVISDEQARRVCKKLGGSFGVLKKNVR